MAPDEGHRPEPRERRPQSLERERLHDGVRSPLVNVVGELGIAPEA